MNINDILNSAITSVKFTFRRFGATFAKRLVWILIAAGVLALGFDVYVYYQKAYLALEHQPVSEVKILKIKEAMLKNLSAEIKKRKEKSGEIFTAPRDLFK